ncbi:MAG TPA: FAD-dependent oxidoreductase [Stellaceae bacterium]|nr:FAD-dependent oxidoreductase [Stellaceae bacterium]
MAQGAALSASTATGALTTRCAIAGGGPAGMMLGLLLARAGIEVVVLEKHADFLRDFRGDTVHPSSLQVIHELGWIDEFLRLPHQPARMLSASIGNARVTIADFTHLPTHCKFIALMPQWDFLNFLAAKGARYPGFKLLTRAEVTDLIEDRGRVVGLNAMTTEGPLEVRADLVVGADGRTSVVRERAKLAVREFGAPMDVLWFRLSRSTADAEDTMGRFDAGRIFITINRGDYWQCGFVIPKGSLERIHQQGLPAFRTDIAGLAPMLADRVSELADWDAVKLLTVRVDRLDQWHRPGLLCIGDAAHAMSPVGGIGINLAIQDAVAAANILARPLREGRLSDTDLAAVQRRREFPTKATQALQVFVQNRIISPLLGQSRTVAPPLPLRLLNAIPYLRRFPARLLGLGIRPEHVRIPASQELPP